MKSVAEWCGLLAVCIAGGAVAIVGFLLMLGAVHREDVQLCVRALSRPPQAAFADPQLAAQCRTLLAQLPAEQIADVQAALNHLDTERYRSTAR